jgi:hypothetical protein
MVHGVAGLLILVITIGMISAVFSQVGFQLDNTHTIFGWIILIIGIFTAVGGIFANRIKLTTQWNTAFVMRVRTIHRSFAYLVLLASLATLTLGIVLFTTYHKEYNQYEILAWINLGFIAMAAILLEFFHRRNKYGKEDPFITKSKPLMTPVEFEKKIKEGKKLHILDNMVLDLSEYMDQHPGGKFLLEHTIGSDISKFFYGGHGLDGNTSKPGEYHPVNTHSNLARKIVNRHIVGIISENAD